MIMQRMNPVHKRCSYDAEELSFISEPTPMPFQMLRVGTAQLCKTFRRGYVCFDDISVNLSRARRSLISNARKDILHALIRQSSCCRTPEIHAFLSVSVLKIRPRRISCHGSAERGRCRHMNMERKCKGFYKCTVSVAETDMRLVKADKKRKEAEYS